MYKKIKLINGEFSTTSLQRIIDGFIIPTSEANKDYQDYFAWVENGNTITED